MASFPSIRVLVTASGTGGHLMPARYMIEAFKKHAPQAQVEFVGAGRPLEEQIIGPTGIPLHMLKTAGLKRRGMRGVFEFITTLPGAIKSTRALFSAFNPDLVLGVGGYATFLPVVMARYSGIPSWIHEAELKPGLANSVLSIFADKISVAFPETLRHFSKKAVVTGHPLRQELREIAHEPAPASPSKLLILGGSQGAQSLDEAGVALAPLFKSLGIEVWHQARKESLTSVENAYQKAQLSCRVMSFIEALPEAYRWADLIISRAGAGAVMELSVVNKPCILVPYPFAQGDHQTANAQVLSSRGKALLIPEGERFQSRLEDGIRELLTPTHYHAMKNKEPVTRSTNAADEIVKGCLALIEARKMS